MREKILLIDGHSILNRAFYGLPAVSYTHLSKDVEDMKLHIHKVQCVIPDEKAEEELLQELDVMQYEKRLSPFSTRK